MRLASFFLVAAIALAQPNVDNVLIKMVPPGSSALVGAHMDQVKQTELYKKLLAAQELGQIDRFAAQSGFDPRRDVREILFVTTPRGGLMLARGSFHLNQETLKNSKRIRHGQYDIWGENSGFCILDSTLAAAGQTAAIESALDEWRSGTHTGAQALLAKAANVNPRDQIWGVANGAANLISDRLPGNQSGMDFSKILKGLQDTWFDADFTAGLRAEVHGTAASEKDAANLRDAAKGVVGLGRLRVPENEPELLRVWDGITVEQQARSIAIRVEIPQDLVDKLVEMLGVGPNRNGKRGL